VGKTTQIKQQRSGIRTHHEAATETHLHCKLWTQSWRCELHKPR